MTPNNNQSTNGSSTIDQKNINTTPGIEKDRQLILDAKKKGKGAVFKTFIKLSGPGIEPLSRGSCRF